MNIYFSYIHNIEKIITNQLFIYLYGKKKLQALF